MKREALIRALRKYARKQGLTLVVDEQSGKGSHYRVRLGQGISTIQSGELEPYHVERICKQLHVNPADL